MLLVLLNVVTGREAKDKYSGGHRLGRRERVSSTLYDLAQALKNTGLKLTFVGVLNRILSTQDTICWTRYDLRLCSAMFRSQILFFRHGCMHRACRGGGSS